MQATLSHKIISVQVERWLAHSELPSGLSPADYLVLFRALREVDAPLAQKLFEHFLKCGLSSNLLNEAYAFQAVQTVILEVLEASTPAEVTQKSTWPLHLSTHERLAQLLDSEDQGILKWPTASPANSPNSISLQCYHVQTAVALVNQAIRQSRDYNSLALDLDILIHETNSQLWDETTGLYRLTPGAAGPISPDQTSPYLTLWAKIPNQDQAEELLIHLRSSAPPWTDASASDWVNSDSYLIYEGLQHFDMYRAAQELSMYLERHLLEGQDNWRTACISLCFAASSLA